MRAINAVLFDSDRTLFNRNATVAGVLVWQVRAFSSAIPIERSVEFCNRITALDDHEHRDKREVDETVAVEFGFAPAVVDALFTSFLVRIPSSLRTWGRRSRHLGRIAG